MRNLIAKARRFVASQRGTTAIEYALIAGGISIAIVSGVSAVGSGIMTAYYDKLVGLF